MKLALTCAAVFSVIISKVLAGDDLLPSGTNLTEQLRIVHDEVNKMRQEAGLSLLCPSAGLISSSRKFAVYQAEIQRETHVGPLDLQQRIFAEGFHPDGGVGENIGSFEGAAATPSGQTLVDRLKGRDSDRQVILSPHFTFMGVGVAPGFDGKVYWTVNFAKERDQQCTNPAFKISAVQLEQMKEPFMDLPVTSSTGPAAAGQQPPQPTPMTSDIIANVANQLNKQLTLESPQLTSSSTTPTSSIIHDLTTPPVQSGDMMLGGAPPEPKTVPATPSVTPTLPIEITPSIPASLPSTEAISSQSFLTTPPTLQAKEASTPQDTQTMQPQSMQQPTVQSMQPMQQTSSQPPTLLTLTASPPQQPAAGSCPETRHVIPSVVVVVAGDHPPPPGAAVTSITASGTPVVQCTEITVTATGSQFVMAGSA